MRTYLPWTAQEEQTLLEMKRMKYKAAEIAIALDRSSGAVSSRWARLKVLISI